MNIPISAHLFLCRILSLSPLSMTYMGSDKYGLVTYISVIFLSQNVSTKPPHVHYLTVYQEWGATSLPRVFQGFTEDISWHWGHQWGDNPEESDSVITSVVAENIWSFEAAEVWESALAWCWTQAVLSLLSHKSLPFSVNSSKSQWCVKELSKSCQRGKPQYSVTSSLSVVLSCWLEVSELRTRNYIQLEY